MNLQELISKGIPTVSSSPTAGFGVALDGAGRLPVTAPATALPQYTADPAILVNGMVWLRSDTSALKVQIGGSTKTFVDQTKTAGYQFDYKEITSDVTFSANAEASAVSLIIGNSVTLDGEAVWVHVFSPMVQKTTTAADQPVLTVWEDGTNIGRIENADQAYASAFVPVNGWIRRTPSAGAHQYILKGHVAGGDGVRTASLRAGAGGSGNLVAAFIRVIKV